MSTHVSTEAVVEEVTAEEGARIFDERARALLGISGSEFIAAYEGGQAWTEEQTDAVTELTMLLPFAR